MEKRLNVHSNFFSSLKQVEKRLKLENSSLPQQSPETNHNSIESLSSPLYLYVDEIHSNVGNQSCNLENSETPIEFLSNSVDFPQTHETPSLESHQNDAQVVDFVEEGADEIGFLIELLGLSKIGKEEMDMSCSSCHCFGGFYDKIVGIKGPKCGKEIERLDGWIEHFRGEKIEPFRLVHLLLGKATCLKGDDDDDGDGVGGGFEAVMFPSTIEEFLRHDPPITSLQEGGSGGG